MQATTTTTRPLPASYPEPARSFLEEIGVKIATRNDRAFFGHWCSWAASQGGEPEDMIGPEGMAAFQDWLVGRGFRESSALEMMRRTRAAIYGAMGTSYRAPRVVATADRGAGKHQPCPCGDGASARPGGIMCMTCRKAYMRSVKGQSRTPLGMLRKAMLVLPASVLALHMRVTSRDVWLRYVARAETTAEQGAACWGAATEAQRERSVPRPRVEDHIYCDR